VFQPFDNKGPYDKRYDDTIAPAIKATGLEPYRVDRDDGAVILYETLHEEIKSATLCLADISALNPNVMYELGFALASGKDVVIICSTQLSSKFPFDIQHRGVIQYASDSISDFEKLKSDIIKRIEALVKKQASVQNIVAASPVKTTEGLLPHEISALAIILANRKGDDGGASLWSVKNDMDKAGFNDAATNLALIALGAKSLIEETPLVDQNGEPDASYVLTPAGVEWLLSNQEKLELRKPSRRQSVSLGQGITDDDVPF
jgi:nucleoside 2-deoxyribosyltransferase